MLRHFARRFTEEQVQALASRPLTVGKRDDELGFKLQKAAAVTGGGHDDTPTKSSSCIISYAIGIAERMNSQG